MSILPFLIFIQFIPFISNKKISRKNYEAQLYEDLLFDYNKISRPVKNSTDVLHIDVGASLIRIIDVDEKNQVLTTNLWLEMRWNDARLQWDPKKYGDIRQLHIPSTDIWIPDFVLYDNAAGDPDITLQSINFNRIFTDALISYNGRVFWQPPAIYKSFCPIKVKWFPYDKQDCRMKFGAWSYTGNYVDLHLIQQENAENLNLNNKHEINKLKKSEEEDLEYNEMGMDLSFFYKSAEWDLMNLTSARHSVHYTSCCGPETLFFTCNLIVPCFLISFLTTFVFYLPDHKITFSISILVTLTVFFLILIDLMPPTSLEIPIFGQYLIMTMILVALSTLFSVASVNIRFRNGSTHQMTPWIRIVFLSVLPKILLMKRPERKQENSTKNKLANFMEKTMDGFESSSTSSPFNFEYSKKTKNTSKYSFSSNLFDNNLPQTTIIKSKNQKQKKEQQPPPYSLITIEKNFDKNNNSKIQNEENIYDKPTTSKESKQQFSTNKNQKIKKDIEYTVHFIADHFRQIEEDSSIANDWSFVAMVLDRFFLIVFSILNLATFSIITSAPTLFDFREPLNITVPTRPLGQAYLFNINEEK